jgi:hypothetical protein
MGGMIDPMENPLLDTITIDVREVAADQIDEYGGDCAWCQLDEHQVANNVYLTLATGRLVAASCDQCVNAVLLHHIADLAFDQVVVEHYTEES